MSVGAVNKQTGDRIPTAGMPAIDSVLSGTSTNPVQNRVVKAALDEKVDAVSGKGLSANDYTNADKAKVDASLNVFTGTQSAWAALSTAEKKTYQRADFTDDYDNTAIGDLSALQTSAKSSIVNAINEVNSGLTDLEKTTGIFSNGIVPPNDSVEVTLVNSGALEQYMLYTYGDSSQFSTVTYLTYNFNGVYEAAPIVSNTGVTITAALPNNKIRITNNTSYNCFYKIKKL